MNQPYSVRAKIAHSIENSDYRAKLVSSLCSHLAKGLSIASWIELSPKYTKKLLDILTEDELEEIELARAKGQLYWESIGVAQSEGTCLGNSRTWYYNMSNRYGWRDKTDVVSDSKHSHTVNIVKYE